MLDLLGKEVYYCVVSETTSKRIPSPGNWQYSYAVKKKKATVVKIEKLLDVQTGKIFANYGCAYRLEDGVRDFFHEENGELISNSCSIGGRRRRYYLSPVPLSAEAEIVKTVVLENYKNVGEVIIVG